MSASTAAPGAPVSPPQATPAPAGSRHGAIQPFFETAAAPLARRRLLLVSYHFPPGSATGALRWQKMARVAHERGWRLDVVTAAPEQLDAPDWTRLRELPPGVRLFGARARLEESAPRRALGRALHRLQRRWPAGAAPPGAAPAAAVEPDMATRDEIRFEPSLRALARAFRAWEWVRADARWARSAARLARALARTGGYDALVTCGPPHMAHAHVARVARRSGIPLVMDLRDPWSQLPFLPRDVASPLWYALARRLEARAVRAASLVVANTEPLRLALRRSHPAAAERIVTVTNGCDDEPTPPPRHGRRFTLAFAGTIYIDRDPRPLLRALAALVRAEALGPEDVGADFVGNAAAYGGVGLERLAREAGVGDLVRLHPHRPRSELLEFLAGAAMLVSLPQDTELQIPSKIFEYMQFSAWLLVLARPESGTAMLLRGSGADVVAPDDEAGLAAVLARRYREYRSGVRPEPLAADGRFSRRRQAGLLFDELERRLGGRGAPPREAAQAPIT
ncbi:MAG TPA: glycosyltransferase [Longimicrobiales bacterium]|nr:glycosyltransferase [Longimicrobiales bacterium]